MEGEETTIDKELMKISGRLSDVADENTKVINLLEALLLTKKARESKLLAENRVIAANSSYKTHKIGNVKYSKARLYINAVTTTGAGAGASVFLSFGSHSIGGENIEIIKIPADDKNAKNIVSLPFNIDNLSNFYFEVKNNDANKTVKIANMRVVLFN